MSTARAAAIEVGRVLVVGELRAPIRPADPHAIAAPASIGELRGALSVPRGAPFDAAIVADWSKEISLTALVDELRRAVREAGTVAFVVPIVQPGWRGARSAMLAVLRGRRPVPLEEPCRALLLGGLVDVRVRAIEGAHGYAVISAEVPPRWPDDVESSTIRKSL